MNLPDNVAAYARSPEFDQHTIPAALRKGHATKPGTWALGEDLQLDAIEKRAIELAIAKHDGNVSRAAQELGLGRTTLYRKMSRHGI